ncbi:MAG: site-2 protease family protein [Chloroflexi bacterium]|nr:site-2 protease family protein [Chloroflexota bacterium]MCL5274836.1 site-2 protease family protein [Chloroflexota bacterium]
MKQVRRAGTGMEMDKNSEHSDSEAAGNQSALDQLRTRITDVMRIENAQVEVDRAVAFSGQLIVEAEEAFDKLKARFEELGYIPLLRENEAGQNQVIVAIKGKLQSAFAERRWLNALLFAATIVTTTLFGGMYASRVQAGQSLPTLQIIVQYGLPFSITLLTILGVHELGHYIQARRHALPVTLPYFIPAPFGLGTFGAFIQMRGAVENKRSLFDVGVGGPIAGLLVALPLFVVGLLMSTVSNMPAPSHRSLLIDGLISLFRPDALTNGILLNPVLLAARFGLIITAINLLPVGQLDGGHIAYAALGRRWATWIGYATIAVMAVLGFTVSTTWFVWMGFALLSGVQHAQPLNDITPLDARRNAAFLATAVLFLSLFSAQPF